MTTAHPAADAPARLFDDPAAEQRWRDRFTAPRSSLPVPARDAPQRTVYVSNASGTFELYTFDTVTDIRTRATDRPDGTPHGTLSADGRSLWWFDDEGGGEFGCWRQQPFGIAADDGGQSAAEALPGVPPGFPAGVAVGRTMAIAGFSDDDGTRIHLAADGGIRTVYRHRTDGGLDGLSHDETIWVLSHSEHGDSRYPALRAFSVATGEVLAELDDTPGRGLAVLGFAPVAGDQRVLVGHEREGRDEIGIWDIPADSFHKISLDLPGDVDATFYPDAAALLVVHSHQGRSDLLRYRIGDGELTVLPTPPGTISAALARPDGSVWYRHSSAVSSGRTLVLPAGSPTGPATGTVPAPDPADHPLLLPSLDGLAPGSEPVIDLWVDGPGGRIHALLARPATAPPIRDGYTVGGAMPTVFLVHGGPAAADMDAFDAVRATYLDAGIAVCQVNYRGSTGYGSAWRDALTDRIGHTELADIAAVQDALVNRGLVTDGGCAIAGHSWGGFLTLLALGTQPSRWVCGVAGVPVADYIAAYADEMEPMRAYDRSLFGGSPEEVPDRYIDSSPLTWLPSVQAPLLVLAGENDPRCPIRQIDNYLAALAERGKDYRVYRFDAGHGSLVVEERLRQTAVEVDFVRGHLLGQRSSGKSV